MPLQPTRTHDRRAHAESINTPISKIAVQILEVLGARLATQVVGLADTKALGVYARGERSPRPDTEQRLRVAHQVIVSLYEGKLSQEAIQAWFVGMNPDLDDEPPAKEIVRNPKSVLDAARAFVEGD